MSTVALVLAAVGAALHVGFFVLESVVFQRPAVHRTFGVRTEDAETVRNWAFNQGWYNLFLAIGTIVGIGLAAGTDVGRDWALVAFGCAFMVGAAAVLLVTDRRMARAAAIQGGAPLVALVLMLAG